MSVPLRAAIISLGDLTVLKAFKDLARHVMCATDTYMYYGSYLATTVRMRSAAESRGPAHVARLDQAKGIVHTERRQDAYVAAKFSHRLMNFIQTVDKRFRSQKRSCRSVLSLIDANRSDQTIVGKRLTRSTAYGIFS